MTKRLMILAACLGLALLTNLSFRVPTPVQAQAPAVCLTGLAPGFTFGTQKNVPLPGGGVLPDGDLFYLGRTIQFTTQSPGANFFVLTPANFGSYPGYAGTESLGFSASTPNAGASAVSCLDSIWDINFEIAGTGATIGDVITLSFQQPGGGGVLNIAQFVVQANPQNPNQLGVRVTGLLAGATLDAIGHSPTVVGTFIPFEEPAGSAGQRTRLITIALPMNGTVPDCNQLVVNIQRAAGVGTTSVALINVVVTRNPTTTATGTGLQTGQQGTYPTGLRCTPNVCPVCPAPIACNLTICFDDASAWCNRLALRAGRRDYLVTIPDLNFGSPIPVYLGNNINPSVNLFLRCSFAHTIGLSVRDRLQAEYIAAQLTLQHQIPFWYFQLSRQRLACHVTRMLMAGQTRAIPVTLSNGLALTGNSTLGDLFNAAEWALLRGTLADQQRVLEIFKQLNNCSKD